MVSKHLVLSMGVDWNCTRSNQQQDEVITHTPKSLASEGHYVLNAERNVYCGHVHGIF